MTDMSNFNQTVVDEFRANDGQVGGPFAGAPVVIITTKGAKSGQTRVNPLVGQPQEDGTVYIFASAAGGPAHPDWYYNLLAHPDIEVEFGSERYAATATPVTGEARDQIFARQKELMPQFAEYEAKTTRTIPVIALTRNGSGS